MIYIPSDVPWHKEQEYVWLRRRDLYRFTIFFPFLGGGVDGVNIGFLYYML
jgi:hypothetical protein